MTEEKMELSDEYLKRIDVLYPQLPDEMRVRAKVVWEAALFAFQNAVTGEPGPAAIIARALRDAEAIGPRPDKKLNGVDLAAAITTPFAEVAADKISEYAKENEIDPLRVLASISKHVLGDE